MENLSSSSSNNIDLDLSQEEEGYSIFAKSDYCETDICKLGALKRWAPDSTILQNAYEDLIKVREENKKSRRQISWVIIQINLGIQNFWDICTTLKNCKWNYSEKISKFSCFSEKEIVMWAEKFKIPTEPRESYDGYIYVNARGDPTNRHTLGTRK